MENYLGLSIAIISISLVYHFCNVVLELDLLSYCSTDEYPEELDRLIRLDNAIQVSIARFLIFNLCEQGLTIHPSFQFPRIEFSTQRRKNFFVKAFGSRRDFSNITFNSLLHCCCILHSIANKTGSSTIDVKQTRISIALRTDDVTKTCSPPPPP